jgi:type IV pilus assembly protein PilA
MLQFVLRRLRPRQTAELEGMGAAEAGFTLIELMVVLLIIAILLAIAIPTFLGVTSSANDRAAQSNLTNGLTEATAQYQNSGQTFSGVPALLSASAPEYTWTASTSTCATGQPNCISVDPDDAATSNDNQAVVLAAMSKTGTCWWVAQIQAAPVAISGTGFITAAYSSTHAAGMEMITSGGTTANISTAGTYYAKRPNANSGGTNTCYANYAETDTAGFNWGSSFGTAGSN